jgi:hypothetical protein
MFAWVLERRTHNDNGLQMQASCVSDTGKLGRTTLRCRVLQTEPLAFAVTPLERLVLNP